MTMQTTGTVVSTKKDATGFKIGDTWFSVHKQNTGLQNVVKTLWKQSVTVDYDVNEVDSPDGTKRTYYNVRKINGSDGKTVASTPAAARTPQFTAPTTQTVIATPTQANATDWERVNAWEAVLRSPALMNQVGTVGDAIELWRVFRNEWELSKTQEETAQV